MPPDTSDLDPKQPSPGENPLGDVSGQPAPTSAPDESAQSSAADDTDVLEVDEIEELDDVEVIDDSAAASAAPPPPPGGTVRTAAPPPPRPNVAPVAPAATEAEPEPSPSLEQRLQRPTVLDQVLEDVSKGDWERRAKELLRDLDAASDRRQVGAIAYELGDFYERRVGDEARAVKAYGRALQSDPSLRPNLWAIRRVFYRRQLWPNLIKLLDAEIRFARNDAERADLHLEKAQILEDKLEDVEAAKQAYLAAAGLDPLSVTALAGIERIALGDGDNIALAKAWRGLASAVGHPSRKVAYLLDLSRLQSAEGDASIDAASETMREAAEVGVDVRYITRERLRLAELSNDPHALLEALEAQTTDLLAQYGPSGPGEDPAQTAAARDPSAPLDRGTMLRLQMVALRRRQARVALDRLADADRAWEYLTRALRVAPGEPLVMADLADVAEKLGKFDALAQLCQGWESLEGDPTRSLSLSLRRADALLRSGDRDQANELLATLSSAAPGFLPITALRERDALDRRDWSALAAVYESAAEAARLGTTFGPGSAATPDAAGAAAYYVSAGDLHATLAGDLEAARAAYGLALETRAAYAPAVEALTTLYEQTGQVEEAVALLEAQAKAAAAEDHNVLRGQLLERLADLYDRLGRLEPLIESLSELLALHPTSKALRWRLDAALRQTERHADRVDVLGRLARAEDDPNKRAAVLVEAGRLCEHALDDKERAAALYREVLEAVPGDRYARAALVSLLRAEQRWDELVAERKAEADYVEDGPGVARALREAAWVLRQKLDKAGAAADLYRELLDRVPDDAFALRGLADALGAAGDVAGLAEVLERDAAAQTEPAAQAAAYLRLGGLLERNDRLADALEAYRSANDADPERVLAAVAMYELAVRNGDTNAQVEALRALAVHRPAAEVRADLLEEIGWLGALRLEDYDRAAGAFQAAISAGSQRVDPRLGNALVQARRGEMDELGDALGELAKTVEQPTAKAALLLRAATVAEVAGDRERASARLARAMAAAPKLPGVLVTAAEHLPLDPLRDQPAMADANFEDAAIDAAVVYRGRAKLAGDAMARQDWSLDAAAVLERRGRLAEAGKLIGEVLRARPDDVRALELLRRVCQRGGDRKSLAAASLALARIVGDPAGKLELLREAASIYDSELNQVAVAVSVYRRILGEDPGAAEFDRLRAIYSEHDDVGGLIELVGDRLKWLDQQQTGPQRKVPLLLERGRLRNKIGDVQGAARDLAALYDIDTRNAEALREQAGVMLQLGDHEIAIKRLERYLEVELDPEKRGWAELTLSQVLAENMDDIAGAIAQLERVISQSADDVDVRERLIALVMRAKDYHRAIREVRELKRLRKSSAERARDELRVATLCRDQLKDAGKAKQALERARQLDPLNIDAIRDLAALSKDSEEKKQVLRHAASDIRSKIAESPERVALYDRLSVVAQWQNTNYARFLALQAVDALGALSAEQRRFVETRRKSLDEQVDVPTTAITAEDWRNLLAHPQAGGFASELWSVLADAATKLTGVDSSRLGFSRADRTSLKAASRQYPSLAHGMASFGVSNVELYISESKKAYARVVSASRPMVYLAADVAKAHTAAGRFLLGRALTHLRTGTGTVAHMRNDELALLFAAAANVAGVSPLPEVLAGLEASAVADRAKALHKHLGRRERKNLALLASRFSELSDPVQWRSAVMSTAARAGLLLAGDISVALDILDVGRGGRSLKDNPAALALLAWAVGNDHAALRRKLAVVKRT